MEKLIEKGRELIEKAERILVFSGAGLSTESGIPDFRSPGGVWSKYDPSDFYYHRLIESEQARVTYWQMSSEMYRDMRDARPNPAHRAIKELEDRGKLLVIVTQNIDRLHHKAGNSPDRIIEIHGTAFSVSCLSCRKKYDRDGIEDRLRAGVKDPACDDCGGILKPETISFGQSMPQEKMVRALHLAGACDLCMVLGSSLVVYPAASVPQEAFNSGARLIIVNRDETPLSSRADVAIRASVTEVMKKMVG
jgi:NAD-dependent deacetylase